MQINNINGQNIKGLHINNLINRQPLKQSKYVQETCYKMCELTGISSEQILDLTKNANIDKFNFLKTLAYKFHKQNFYKIEDDSQHILNIYNIVDTPSALHFDIVKRNKDSFDKIEKIFSLAQDEKSLEFVQLLQYDILKNKENPSKTIIDLLSSKNRQLFIEKPEKYSSYLKLYADEKDAVKVLDSLIESKSYSRFKFDAQYAVSKLMKNKRFATAMSGKTGVLEKLYTKERADFLNKIIKAFIPAKTEPKETTKAIVVELYGTLNKNNADLRQSIISSFKSNKPENMTDEINAMQKLFNKIDTDPDAKKFVIKAINKDLRVNSIMELNEIIENTPLKKANIFFNNAKRIIELSGGEERKSALVNELENPFFEPQKKKISRMFEPKQNNNIFIQLTKMIENKYNQFLYNRIAA